MFDYSLFYFLVDYVYQFCGQNCMQLVFNLKCEENEILEEGGLRCYMYRVKFVIYFYIVLCVSDVNFGFCGCNIVCDRDELWVNIYV